jgi:hypothetical protein
MPRSSTPAWRRRRSRRWHSPRAAAPGRNCCALSRDRRITGAWMAMPVFERPPSAAAPARRCRTGRAGILRCRGMAVALDSFDLAFQRIAVGDGVRRVALQRHLVEQAAALAGRHLRQEELAAGRAMCRHARPGMQVEAQRRRGLDAVEVEHFAAGQRGDVAAFADFLDQLAQHRMARAMHRVVEQQVLGQAAQAQAGCRSGGRRPPAAACRRFPAAAACGAGWAWAGRFPRPDFAALKNWFLRAITSSRKTGAAPACRRRCGRFGMDFSLVSIMVALHHRLFLFTIQMSRFL